MGPTQDGSRVASGAALNPAVALTAGVVLLGEPFTLGTAIGFVRILAGSWLATGPSERSVAAHGPAEAIGVSPAQTPGER